MRNSLLLFLLLAIYCEFTVQLRIGRHVREMNSLNDNRVNNHQSKDKKYYYETKTFEVPIDHFSFTINSTFKIRYLINNTWQREIDPPIFFYTGNEGSIETFAENTGFMWDIASDFHALLVFAEHRYYGQSMPFGNDSYSSPKHLGYLTSQQAIADYVDLIEYFRSQQQYGRSPVIVFGGSYGGMLSAWMRMKYPHIVQGAIASSAPILQFTGITDCEAFSRITTSDFRTSNPYCAVNIRKSWGEITNISSTDDGKKWISDTFKLCVPLKNESDVKEFKSLLIDMLAYLAMVDYPYPADFLTPLPANPIDAFCEKLSDGSLKGKPLLIALQDAVNVYTNYTGKTTCVKNNDAAPGLDAIGWPYQACTEMVMPMCNRGDDSIFEPEDWNLKEYSDDCFKKFQVRPKPNLACKQYGCMDLSTVTNIVFSNGLIDPWSGGGVMQNLSDSAIAILIPEGAHHLDLRGSHENDPYSVIQARKYHRDSILKWIREYQSKTASFF